MNPVLPRYRAAGEWPIAPTKRTNRVVGELTASCICPKSSLALVGFPKPREVFPVWDQPLPVLDSFGQLPRSPAVRWPGTKASRIGFRPSGSGSLQPLQGLLCLSIDLGDLEEYPWERAFEVRP